ncbi:hypothetical protein [Thiomonas sp.]
MKYYRAFHPVQNDATPTKGHSQGAFSLLALLLVTSLGMIVWSVQQPDLWAAYVVIGLVVPIIGLRLAMEIKEESKWNQSWTTGLILALAILLATLAEMYLTGILNPAWIGVTAGIGSATVIGQILAKVVL